jgi:hypothetical protein
MIRNSYDMPSTSKTTALPTTSMSSLLITLHQHARERSIIFQLSHNVSGRSDTLKTSSLQLRSTTVAPTRVYGSKCTTLRRLPLDATKTTWQDTSPLLWGRHRYGSIISQQSASPPGQLFLTLHYQLRGNLQPTWQCSPPRQSADEK